MLLKETGTVLAKSKRCVKTTPPNIQRLSKLSPMFLEADRNESYLLLKDVGENAHEARKKGRLTPRECLARSARRICMR